MSGIRNFITAVAVVTLAGACAPATNSLASDDIGDLAPRGRAATTLEVENNNWATMNVYALRGSSRVRLGTVTSMSRAVFRIPASLLNAAGDVRLMADPIGSSNTHVTPSIQVNPGERIEFTIQNHLATSSVSVWGRE
jgi:hypothetical protein